VVATVVFRGHSDARPTRDVIRPVQVEIVVRKNSGRSTAATLAIVSAVVNAPRQRIDPHREVVIHADAEDIDPSGVASGATSNAVALIEHSAPKSACLSPWRTYGPISVRGREFRQDQSQDC
jgi:hypothetical protein